MLGNLLFVLLQEYVLGNRTLQKCTRRSSSGALSVVQFAANWPSLIRARTARSEMVVLSEMLCKSLLGERKCEKKEDKI